MPASSLVNRLFPYGSRRYSMIARLLEPPPHAELVRNHRTLSDESQGQLRNALIRDFFTDTSYYPDPPAVYLATEGGRADLDGHMLGRLTSFRSVVVPWLNSSVPLKGKKILEIGAGTGASTVALAEQGAQVVGIDVSERALAVGRERSKLYGVDAEFALGNAAEMSAVIGNRQFDCIIYFAVLEHMTPEERLLSLSAAWRHLKPGKHLVVIETPNCLWWFDSHTSNEPFFHWISDDVAFAYSRLTKREIYNRIFRGPITDDGRTLLARWGRGASYHDFVLSLDIPKEALPVVSYLSGFRRQGLSALWRIPEFEVVLRRLAPDLPRGFLCSYLNVILQKNS